MILIGILQTKICGLFRHALLMMITCTFRSVHQDMEHSGYGSCNYIFELEGGILEVQFLKCGSVKHSNAPMQLCAVSKLHYLAVGSDP